MTNYLRKTYLFGAVRCVKSSHGHASVHESDDLWHLAGSWSVITQCRLVTYTCGRFQISSETLIFAKTWQINDQSQSKHIKASYLPNSATNLGLVLCEVNCLEDHVLAIPDKVLIIIVTEV